jgi:hypothetical protein
MEITNNSTKLLILRWLTTLVLVKLSQIVFSYFFQEFISITKVFYGTIIIALLYDINQKHDSKKSNQKKYDIQLFDPLIFFSQQTVNHV